MSEKILFVDDDSNVLEAYKRQLRKKFVVETALSGEAGLNAITQKGPFAVVVADMQMPVMDGVRFLAGVKEGAPDSVRMMLTGNADQQTAVNAVNEGHIFRFLTKPCSTETLTRALKAGVEQYRLVTAERDLLEKTLSGCVQVLFEILAAVDQESFKLAERLTESAELLARSVRACDSWELKVACMLSQIGCVAIPASVVAKIRSERGLSAVENEMVERVPEVGGNLLKNIPRMESVAEIILYQNKRFDGSGFPNDEVAGDKIPLGSRILKVLSDLVQIEADGTPRSAAVVEMRQRQGWYDPEVLDSACSCLVSAGEAATEGRSRSSSYVTVNELRVGQLLMSDIETVDGKLLISVGHRISRPILERIKNFAKLRGVKETIHVEYDVLEENNGIANLQK